MMMADLPSCKYHSSIEKYRYIQQNQCLKDDVNLVGKTVTETTTVESYSNKHQLSGVE